MSFGIGLPLSFKGGKLGKSCFFPPFLLLSDSVIAPWVLGVSTVLLSFTFWFPAQRRSKAVMPTTTLCVYKSGQESDRITEL